MQIDFGTIADKLSANLGDIILVIAILISGLIIGKIVGKLVRILMEKTGLIKILKGSKAQKRTKDTSFTIVNFTEIIIRWTIYLIAVGQAIEILGLESLNAVTNDLVSYLPNVVIALIIMIFGFIISDKVIMALDEFLQESRLPNYAFLTTGVRYFIYFVAVIMALSQLHISTQVLLIIVAVASFLGAVFIAIGARELATNFFAGAQIIWHKTIKVGDLVQTGEFEGVIEDIGIINTLAKTDKGEYLIIPNSKLANGIVTKKK